VLFSSRVRVRIGVRIRVRIRFSVWLVSDHTRVFVLLFVVIVTLPVRNRLSTSDDILSTVYI